LEAGLAEISTVSATGRSMTTKPGASAETVMGINAKALLLICVVGVPSAAALYRATYIEVLVSPVVELRASVNDVIRYRPGPQMTSPSTK
jgi:hypothetical protein